jgi:hypothetical protein
MRMPGFVAETALYKSIGSYVNPLAASQLPSGTVTAQASLCYPYPCPPGWTPCSAECPSRHTPWGSCCYRCCPPGRDCDSGCGGFTGAAYCNCI